MAHANDDHRRLILDQFTRQADTLTFAPDESTKTITIEVKGDSMQEANETFFLDLFGRQRQFAVHQEPWHTILNDD